MAAKEKLDLDPDKVNPMGSATALGHPVEASGARDTNTISNVPLGNS